AHEQLHADPGSEREAGDPAGAGVRVVGLQPVERRCGVAELALTPVESSLGAADAPEVKAQDREATALKSLVEGIHDLVVHRPPMLGVRMQHQGNGSIGLPAVLVAALNTPFGPVYNHIWHF